VDMSVHQCYRCELRFADLNEVRDHLVHDHDLDPEAVEAHYGRLLPGLHPRRRAPQAGRPTTPRHDT
jgi:hypothetical protein